MVFIMIFRLLRFKFIVVLMVLFIASCGYKPMSYYANKALGDKIYVKLELNVENTEESVQIKELINEAIVSRFHSKISSFQESDTVLEINVNRIQDSIVATNSQGFATFYRVNVDIRFKFSRNGKDFVFTNSGYFDYANSLVNPIVTYNNRSNAILEASKQSIDRFISQVGYSVVF